MHLFTATHTCLSVRHERRLSYVARELAIACAPWAVVRDGLNVRFALFDVCAFPHGSACLCFASDPVALS